MITGNLPYNADSVFAQAMTHVNQPPPSPKKANLEIPEAFDALTIKLLAKNPEDRYPSATALANDLERILHSGFITEAGQEKTENHCPPARRGRPTGPWTRWKTPGQATTPAGRASPRSGPARCPCLWSRPLRGLRPDGIERLEQHFQRRAQWSGGGEAPRSRVRIGGGRYLSCRGNRKLERHPERQRLCGRGDRSESYGRKHNGDRYCRWYRPR